MNILVFDIETIPDAAAGRELHQFDGLSDDEVVEAMLALRRAETGGSEFLPLYLHRIVAISAVLRCQDKFKVWTLGDIDAPEAEIIQRFYDGIDRYKPTLISWNGSSFDLPVIHYRSLIHKISAPCYWDTGKDDQNFKWNNYINRYHERHSDLMDILAAYQARAAAPLDKIASLCGFPGKMGMSGAKVWEQYQKGELESIRSYCETDVLNTFLVYLRFELMRGNLTNETLNQEYQLIRESLIAESKPHLEEFLNAWKSS